MNDKAKILKSNLINTAEGYIEAGIDLKLATKSEIALEETKLSIIKIVDSLPPCKDEDDFKSLSSFATKIIETRIKTLNDVLAAIDTAEKGYKDILEKLKEGKNNVN